MDKDKMILKLNWFFNLELTQVDFYNEQSKFIDDKYIKSAFEHFSNVEQQHVDNIASAIKTLGGNPLPILDFAAPLFGKASGRILSWTGLDNLIKTNIFVEEKAKADYISFIEAIQDSQSDKLIKTLTGNLIDEDLHIAWLQNKLKEQKE